MTTTNADPFDVWGKPPESIITRLTEKQLDALRAYVSHTAKKVYRLAHDIGYDSGLETAEAMIGKRRQRHNKS
jgi:hypothetical protein